MATSGRGTRYWPGNRANGAIELECMMGSIEGPRAHVETHFGVDAFSRSLLEIVKRLNT